MNKWKFSIRFLLGMLLVIGVLSTIASSWHLTNERHLSSQIKLSSAGFLFLRGFEDPIGPNVFYTRRNSVPPNGFFSKTFSNLFCICGHYECQINDLSPGREQLALLQHLVHLKIVTINKSSLPPNWVEALRGCESLNTLSLIDLQIERKSIRDLAKLKIRRLVLAKILWRGEFLNLLSEMTSLEELVLNDSGIPHEDLLRLRERLPNCEIHSQE